MCTVLVTGGAGFLGQHVVGLLQTRAEHVTEIRVLDIVPYENKLDYVHKKPLRVFVGSITDEAVLKEACRDVQSVIHIAGLADSRMFPDADRIHEVNVKGTLIALLTALGTVGVQRFIHCSTTSIGIGYDSDTDGWIKESDPVPDHMIFVPYASSKLVAERIVQSANSESFRTVCLRPVVMYGELDNIFITAGQQMARNTGGTLMSVRNNGVKQRQAYVGNVAYGFVCAEATLYREQSERKAGGNPSVNLDVVNKLCDKLCAISKRDPGAYTVDTKSDDNPNHDETDTYHSDNVYYILDDCPPSDPFVFQAPFLEGSGYSISPYRLPISLLIVAFFFLYYILKCVRLFFPRVNYPVSIGAVKFLKKPYLFSDEKARENLGYKPLYSPEEAFERSMIYYKRNSYS